MTEPCCPPGRCAYSTSFCRYYLDRFFAFERAGEDQAVRYSAAQMGRFGDAPGDGRSAELDVSRVVLLLRQRGEPVTVRSVAEALCPFSGST